MRLSRRGMRLLGPVILNECEIGLRCPILDLLLEGTLRER